MAGEWTLPGIGDDLMSSAKFGERRLKVESSLVSGGEAVSACNPIPTNGDSIYRKDVWAEESNLYNFSGSVYDLFCDLHSTIVDSTTNATKSLFIHFNRTVVSNVIGLGSYSGNFSNVKIEAYNSGGIATTVIDESAINTKYTSRTFQIPATYGFNAIKFTFSTTDTVTLSNCVILKSHAVVSRIQGVRDDGTVGNASLSNSNRLKTVSQPYTYAIAENDIPNHYSLLKFGTRSNVTAGTESVIWEGPTAQYPYLSIAEILKVSSSSTSDTSTGTGMRTIKLYGLDGNYNEITETVTLLGTTVVPTVSSFLRIYRIEGMTCGTAYTNLGTISVTNNAGTSVLAVVNPSDGQTLMTIWTVPLGKKAYLVKGATSTNSNKGAQISIFVRKLNGGILFPWQIKYRGFLFSGGQDIPLQIPFALPEKTDIEMRALTPTSAGTTSVGATFELWYEDE